MKYSLAIFLGFLLLLTIFRLSVFYMFPIQLQDNQNVLFTATLLEDSVVSGSNQLLQMRYGTFWQSTEVQVVAPLDSTFSYGETLTVTGKLFHRLLKNNRLTTTIKNAQIEAKSSGFLPVFGSLRQKIITFCENNFSQPQSGLLLGIVFGMKNYLTNQITTSFRITGLSHLVAASGMNVTMVAGFLFGIFGSMLKRQVAVAVSLFGIFAYVCLSGFDASIVRAALMGSVAFTASLLGRQYSSLYVLLLVGIGMLLWSPVLLTDVGFQLSVLATAGILVLKSSLFSASIFSEDIGTTLAAQLATLPILLGTFGQYSLLSVFANVLVLWTIPLIMMFGGVGILIGLVFEPLGRLIVWCIYPLLWYLQQVTGFFSTHSISVQMDSLPLVFIVGYYCLLLGAVLVLTKKKTN